MKLLLIWPNSRNEVLGWGDLGAIAEPLSLEYLAAGSKADGHEVSILDLRLHPNSLNDVLLSYRPEVVGVTAFSMHVRRALEICRTAKEVLPTCWTVIGGHHATFLPEDFQQPQVDFVVCGEGVGPLRQLLCHLQSSRSSTAAEISGVWIQHCNRWIFGGNPKSFSIDSLPLPDRTTTADDRSRYFIDWMKPIALLRTSVGCPFRCSFCSLWTIMDGKYHTRSISSILEELAAVSETSVFFVDDEAFIQTHRMAELGRAIGLARIQKRLFCYARIDSVIRNKEVLREWRKIGLERLFIGLDAISPQRLDEYNKKCKLAQIDAGLNILRELGIELFAQFVVSPRFTKREFQELERFIEHHKIRYPSFTVLTPLPGTELLSTFESVTELQINGRPNWDLFDCQNAVTATRLAPEEFRQIYRQLYRTFKGSYTQYREHSYILQDIVSG